MDNGGGGEGRGGGRREGIEGEEKGGKDVETFFFKKKKMEKRKKVRTLAGGCIYLFKVACIPFLGFAFCDWDREIGGRQKELGKEGGAEKKDGAGPRATYDNECVSVCLYCNHLVR